MYDPPGYLWAMIIAGVTATCVARYRGAVRAGRGRTALFALPAGLGDVAAGIAAPLVARNLASAAPPCGSTRSA